jgi:stalled ribosome rescue protein Dom34
MATYVIWLDSREAKVFKKVGATNEIVHAHTHGKKHPTEPHGHHADGHHREAITLFKEVAPSLSDASQILLLGPGEAKMHFQKYLVEHSPVVAKKIVGVETVDHPTDPQILEVAAKFFKKLDSGL